MPKARALSITTPVVLFWALFWLTNGSDKFLTDVDFFLFFWRGADWFAEYELILGNAGMPEAVWRTLTVLAGIWEIALGVLLAVALFVRTIGGRDLAMLGVVLSAFIFAVFSGVDVVAGMREELEEHSLFFIIAIVSALALRSQAASEDKTAG